MNQPAEKAPEVMIEVLTSDLTGIALDYAVDMIEGRYQDYLERRVVRYGSKRRGRLDALHAERPRPEDCGAPMLRGFKARVCSEHA